MDEWQIVSFVFAGVILFLCALVKVSINQLDSKVTDLKQRLYDVDKSDSRMEYYRSRQVDANSTLLNKILDLEERIKGLKPTYSRRKRQRF